MTTPIQDYLDSPNWPAQVRGRLRAPLDGHGYPRGAIRRPSVAQTAGSETRPNGGAQTAGRRPAPKRVAQTAGSETRAERGRRRRVGRLRSAIGAVKVRLQPCVEDETDGVYAGGQESNLTLTAC